MAVDREGRELVIRFEYVGETSAVLFDTRDAYHMPRQGPFQETVPEQQEDYDGEGDLSHGNGLSLYELGEQLLRPLRALVSRHLSQNP